MRFLTLDELPAHEARECYTLPFSPLGKPVGFVRITATLSAVLSVERVATPERLSASGFHPQLDEALAAFLAGEIVSDWPVAIALPDAGFLLRCWRELARIGYGETISYSELAARAGNFKAVRAAASACARNPVPLLIPCHRILAKGGGLGGFGWGLPVKRALLEMESQGLKRHAAA